MEAIWFYILAVILGVVLVITYILLVGPAVILKDITGAFTGFENSLFSAFGKAY